MKDLIKVFKDTQEISNQIPNTSVTTKHGIEDILMFVSVGNSVGRKKEIKNNVTVENSDTVSSLVEWSKKGKTCILNMASFKRPGGGFGEATAHVFVFDQNAQLAGQIFGVAGFEEEAVGIRNYQFGVAADTGCNGAAPAGHRFHQGI